MLPRISARLLLMLYKEIKVNNMGKLSTNQIIGIVLLVILAMMFVPIPFIDSRSISAVALLITGIYMLVKK